ncbi:class I SAM-dependent methyltransferase [Tenacibaculum piscium]|uniref:Methyltransferase n=2 Tax=Tenacibaculum piscium TaxID=1458515 RepID=A0A2H1YGX7_9FLAO|nr:class I SAM-dependent methyltransferase [Tenacibaculum piscium]MBE7630308.1 methyltransferase domain-containing protein [Tenacibaculum piscium]MBE7670833.1 methyltransferase domain-containing protein [Tenacibaculum piscium]MBE7685673.1 methyltransferase domain-containing protein [Tenacibaculum piscium]MBE7690336.1 methyltransferase domain-containing protein [Tenacibaculum piscium]MCG8184013.1 class I SAM-dependent methyltransferase [Tenacibaculum piscium]
MKTTNWFTAWFDTTYYHTLYKHRNDADAQFFMRNITSFLKLPKHSHIADLPCGKGRHSVYLNSLGYKVTGGDLSKNSIEYAQKFENETLHFEVWDMRTPLSKKYDAIFNLFTSFGYFDDDSEDIAILKNIKNGLQEKGVCVLDFLNVEKVKNSLVTDEIKTIDGIEFHIKRELKDGFILKHISFFADEKQHNYTEQVKFLTLDKMEVYFEKAGLEIKHVFGDYALNDFDKNTSDRLILIAE